MPLLLIVNDTVNSQSSLFIILFSIVSRDRIPARVSPEFKLVSFIIK